MDLPEENKVIDIWSRKAHSAGHVRCTHCKHEWVGVAAVGTIDLLCPKCGLERGGFILSPLPLDDDRRVLQFECMACDNTIFLIVPEGAYCLGCAITHDWEAVYPPDPKRMG